MIWVQKKDSAQPSERGQEHARKVKERVEDPSQDQPNGDIALIIATMLSTEEKHVRAKTGKDFF